jgi:hypothetical protein
MQCEHARADPQACWRHGPKLPGRLTDFAFFRPVKTTANLEFERSRLLIALCVPSAAAF